MHMPYASLTLELGFSPSINSPVRVQPIDTLLIDRAGTPAVDRPSEEERPTLFVP